jgi:uncharacterized membrane protein YfcA
MKVAAATSSYVIGITAFAGAAVYLMNGMLDIQIAAVVVLGAFIGSKIGVKILPAIDAGRLRKYFSLLLAFLAAAMLLKIGGIL